MKTTMQKYFYLLAIMLGVMLVGCEPDSESEENVLVTTEETDSEYNIGEGKLQTIGFGGLEIDVKELEDAYLFEGDILIQKKQSPVRVLNEGEEPKAATQTETKWKDNKIYYQLAPTLTDKTVMEIRQAITSFHNLTNLEFIEEESLEGHIYFVNGSGCASFLGRTGGSQRVTLGANGCGYGATVHEILHALGFFHEQARSDRDEHITINLENAIDGTHHNFSPFTNYSGGGQNVGEFDFNSIMLYSPYSFSKNGLPTITKKDGSLYTANRSGMSEGDLYAVNKLYPEIGTEPEYVNGNWYYLHGLNVYRANDLWYVRTKYGFKRVEARERVGGTGTYAWYWV